MKAKRYTIAFVLALGLALILAWLLAGARIPGAQAAPQSPTANVIYVDADATGPADGLTWSTAFTEVQDALANAGPGDEIWVTEGVYTPGITRTDTFQLKNGVALYGGFGATETLRTQRDWEMHVTVLSGDLEGNDITDANGVVTSTANIVGANAYHVVTGSGVTETAVLDGFTITAGKADVSGHRSGGGMYNSAGAPQLANVIFRGNSASNHGGGMYNSAGAPQLTNVTFSSNATTDWGGGGGGMYNRDSSPTLTNVAFSGNSSTRYIGGGMYNDDSSPQLTDVIFSGNFAEYDGGGMYNEDSSPQLTDVTFSSNSTFDDGGGMYNHNSSPWLTNVTFSGNTATYLGYGRGGGMYNSSSSSPRLTNVTFSGNSGGDGGGMYNNGSNSPTLINVTFSGNSACCNDGGGMVNWYGSPRLSNVTFSGNSAFHDGGGMVNYFGSPWLSNVTFSGNSAFNGGGMYNYDSSLRLTNVTFSGNSASNGGGMYNNGSIGPMLANTILWGNTASGPGDQLYNPYAIPVISYSLVQGSGGSGVGWDTGLGIDGGGNIDADPQFLRDPDPGDGDWTTLADNDYGDLHLRPSSPAIDAGDNTALPADSTDLDGDGDTSEPIPLDLGLQPRLFDSPTVDTGNGTPPIVDMGAYEQPSRLYVGADATGAGTGLSWTDAYTRVQDALDAAIYVYEIWVAEGVYTPTAGITRTATFQLENGVALYGGFAGTETALSQRNWLAHVTVLSGDLDGSDITNAHGVVTDTAHIVGDNAYHVVSASGVTETAVLDGFTITGGKADGESLYAHDLGGGMISQGSSPQLTNLTFSGNTAGDGGGLYSSGGGPRLTNVTFRGNAASDGGGMYSFGSSPALVNVIFTGNTASVRGGGMHSFNSSPTLVSITFSGNASDTYGGGMGAHGGSPQLANVVFVGNSAGDDGGGMDSSFSNPQLVNVTFSSNAAGRSGGGLYSGSSSTTLANCVLWGNEANGSTDQLAQIYLPGTSAITVTHSLVQGGVYTGTGNISADPQFARSPDPGDGDWTTLADNDYGDLPLQSSSPAIDKGDNGALPADATDLDGDGDTGETLPLDRSGKPRVIGNIVDMGAHEWCLQVFVPLVLRGSD